MSATAVLPEKRQTTPEQPPRPQDAEDVGPYLWTCDEYHRMTEEGFFDDKRVELLDGEILRMPAQLTPHATGIRRTFHVLRGAFGADFDIAMQLPITLSNRSEPEPDVTVARGSAEEFADHHPGPAEIALLVEVLDSTLRRDQGRKARAYARAGVTDYWIVNLVDRRLEVYRDPLPEGQYQDVQVYEPGDTVGPLALPDSEISVADLLPVA